MRGGRGMEAEYHDRRLNTRTGTSNIARSLAPRWTKSRGTRYSAGHPVLRGAPRTPVCRKMKAATTMSTWCRAALKFGVRDGHHVGHHVPMVVVVTTLVLPRDPQKKCNSKMFTNN